MICVRHDIPVSNSYETENESLKFNGFKCENFVGQTEMHGVPGLHIEVRFLVDNSSCSKVLQTPKRCNSSTRPRPQIVATATHGTRIHMRIILMMVTRLALGLFVLYNSFPWLKAELRGCVYYCKHLTVVAVSPAVIDRSNEINAALEW